MAVKLPLIHLYFYESVRINMGGFEKIVKKGIILEIILEVFFA
jgi:hypothetical protein